MASSWMWKTSDEDPRLLGRRVVHDDPDQDAAVPGSSQAGSTRLDQVVTPLSCL